MAKMKSYSSSKSKGEGAGIKQGSPSKWGWQGSYVPASYSYKEQLMQMDKASSVLGKGQSKK